MNMFTVFGQWFSKFFSKKVASSIKLVVNEQVDVEQFEAGRKAAIADLEFRYSTWSCRDIVDHFNEARCFLSRFEGTKELPQYWELADKSFQAGYRAAILAHFEVGVQSRRADREAELRSRITQLEKVGGRPK